MTIWKSKCGTIELRLGRWQDVLADVECDALITDPPYSARTHDAHYVMESMGRKPIPYQCWTRIDIDEFVSFWSAKTRGWIFAMCDHVLIPDWTESFEHQGRYAFSPLACVEPYSRMRFCGDGPTQWSVFAVPARPPTKEYARWGSLRGAYVISQSQTRRNNREGKGLMGGKPISMMRMIVSDYSRQGDLVCDPCAGSATTLLAAAIEGRRAIGAECDPKTYEMAVRRLEGGWTKNMF